MRGFEVLGREYAFFGRWLDLVDVHKCAQAILGDADLCIWDVGAAWGLPAHLLSLQRCAKFHLVEPNPDASELLAAWHRDADDDRDVTVHTVGISEEGGLQDLFVYDGDATGASLLPPIESVVAKRGEPAIFKIETVTLAQLAESTGCSRVDFVKLDIQGAELGALRSLGTSGLRGLLGCELEIGIPGNYVEQPSLEDVRLELAQYGLMLLDVRPARSITEPRAGVPQQWTTSRGQSKKISEVDALFVRTPETLGDSDVAHARMIVLLAAYGYFVEAGNLAIQARDAGIFSPSRTGEIVSALDMWIRKGYRDLRAYHGLQFRARRLWRLVGPSPVIARGRTLWRWGSD